MAQELDQSRPDPFLGYGETSPELAAEGRRQRRRATSTERADDFVGSETRAGSQYQRSAESIPAGRGISQTAMGMISRSILRALAISASRRS